jgi:hypothetical protein
MAKKAKIVKALVQLPLPIRGYTLCDSDWRYPVLRNLHTLGESEEYLLTGLEDEENGWEYGTLDYDQAQKQLDIVTKLTMNLWIEKIVPVMGQWWG